MVGGGVRAGNEAIVKNVGAPESPGTLPFICECGSDSCLEPVHLTAAEYEAVRANPTHFAVVPGREDDDERLIDAFDRFTLVVGVENGRFVVVEKIVEEAMLERIDPRS